jgi:cytochrome c oxidase subunit 1|tara:strand:- start:11150 stop:12991 length:1842 start_codon:yes stop_codon:yes gene_type:complete
MNSVAFLWPIARGVVSAVVGLLIGLGIGTGIAALTGNDPAEINITFGYLFGLIGWLLGIGVWDNWVREWIGRERRSFTSEGWRRYFGFSLDHKVIGVQYLVTFVILFLLAGIFALIMRLELADAGDGLIGPDYYNTIMSLHGIIMVAVAVAAIIGGFANFILPLMIGAEDVAFPRLNALSFWIVPPVAVLLILTPLFGGFDSGWTAYPPLSVINADGQLLFLFAFLTFGLSSILGGLNFLTTTICLRAPGMTWGRLPIFVWSVFAAAIISATATQVVAFGLLMVILDRVSFMTFFNEAAGGKPLLYEHVFWFYSHPAVYIMILPGFGLMLEMISHFSRKPLFAYKWVVGSFLFITVLSFLVWAHHLFTSGMEEFLHIPFMAITELISVPTGVVFLAALGTIWKGRLWLVTPMLFALGTIFNFLIGGLTGIFLADVATDIHLQDTYFVVAHFHYTMMGGEVFMIFGAIYYWFPKITGKMYNETLGKIHFTGMFVSYNVLFLTMFYVGLQGMNRRVSSYPSELQDGNVLLGILSLILGLAFLPFVYNAVASWIKGSPAPDNPWDATTLEWQTTSPPPEENFPEIPVVTGSPYDYGVPGSKHADVSKTPLSTVQGD